MKCLVALEAKQGDLVKYHAMCALVATPSHSGRGGKVGIVGRLVNVHFFLLYNLCTHPIV
jgi:hypothetical protein